MSKVWGWNGCSINVDRPQGGDIFLCAPLFHTVWTADLPDDCICLIFIQPCCIEIFQLLQLIILKQFLPPLMYTLVFENGNFQIRCSCFSGFATCEEGQFLCETTNECIPVEFVCDRYNDCGDDENEFCRKFSSFFFLFVVQFEDMLVHNNHIFKKQLSVLPW